MMANANGRLVEVFTGDLWEAEVIKGLLESEGIISMVKDETLGVVTGYYLNTGKGVKVLVNEEDEQRAKSVIEENQKEA